MRPRLDETVEAVAGVTAAATPAFAGIRDAKFARDLRTAVRVALERFLDLVGTDGPALSPSIREVFVGLGAAEAREDRGPDALLAALRTASRLMLRTACAAIAEVRPVGTGELVDLADAVSAYADELAAASTDGFALQLREQAGEGDRRRRHLAETLLRGNAPESVVGPAAAGVGWPGLGVVVPVVLPLDRARDARFRFGADGLVVERERDAVLLLPAARWSRGRLADALAGRGAVVGPGLDWSRVPEAVRLAELTAAAFRAGPEPARPAEPTAPTFQGGPEPARPAEPTARVVRGGPEPVRVAEPATPTFRDGPEPVFAEDFLAALALRGEPGALAVLTERRLAPLAGLRAVQRERLLETLHAWLRRWGARAEVSAELFVHPQTVSYRLNRLRDLLGDALDDPTARFELLLVLESRAPRPASRRSDRPAG